MKVYQAPKRYCFSQALYTKRSAVACIILLLCSLLAGCQSNNALEITRSLFGYTPPPKKTTVLEELQLEYERCMKIGIEEDCAQAAYDVVRKVKDLDPKVVPKGIVVILQENWEETNSDAGKEAEESDQEEKSSQQKKGLQEKDKQEKDE
jgi:hypothetical protein